MTALKVLTSSDLAEGKVDQAVWYHRSTQTTHTVEVRLQRAEPKPPLYRLTHVVVHADGEVTDRSYLYDSVPKTYAAAGKLREASPTHRPTKE
jgi:hypothetical protein